ncbi:MAG TPA: hypothetical protein V6C65_16375 [Allocoleopsis sp.]
MTRWHHWIKWSSWAIALFSIIGAIEPALALSHLGGDRIARREAASDSAPRRTVCPSDLDELVPLMLRDLPSYANRVSQRAYTTDIRNGNNNIPGYVLLAGRPEYEPLQIASRGYIPFAPNDTSQVFFTTLERQYTEGKSVNLQNFHWVFLTHTDTGWRFVISFSALNDDPANQPPTPPQDSSQGVIAQAIRLWLRDCAAGSIDPPS